VPKFFVDRDDIRGGDVFFGGDRIGHLRALRLRPGGEFIVCDGENNDYSCVLTELSGKSARARILKTVPSMSEPSVSCVVYAAFSKGDRPEYIVQKSVEMGAGGIIFFESSRCVSKPEGGALTNKLRRYAQIAEEAAGQAGRGIVPKIGVIRDFSEAVSAAAKANLPLIFYEEENTSIREILDAAGEFKSVSVMTGPEGGFEPEEAALAVAGGMRAASLGPRILRCETAPVCALSAIMYFTGNM
jgi:16S rRNA (uracil1498-N3)-methyltransferase